MTDEFLLREFEAEEIGIFESLRTYNGRIFREEEHLDRFAASAKTALGASINRKRMREELRRAVRAFYQERENGGKGEGEKAEIFIRLMMRREKILVMIGERRHPSRIYEKGVKLKTSPVRRSLSNASPAEAKTSAYQNAVLATLEPSSEETYEWVFLDRMGYVTEVRIGNLFIVLGKKLVTPPEIGILNGVTRRFVIECARKAWIFVSENPLTRHEIFNADEAFLTNTSWEILPVAELDCRAIGKKCPGPVTAKLQKIFKQNAMKESR